MSHKIQIITMCTYNINWSWTCWLLEPKVAMVLVIIKAGVRVRWVSDYDAGWCIQVSFLYKGKRPILLWVSGVHWNPCKKKSRVIFIVMTKTSFFQRMYSMKIFNQNTYRKYRFTVHFIVSTSQEVTILKISFLRVNWTKSNYI